MKMFRACLVAAAVQLTGIAIADAQTWVDVQGVSVEGRGRGDACVDDAISNAKPSAWQSALAHMNFTPSEPLARCAETKAGRLLEVRPQKRDTRWTGDDRCQVPLAVRYRGAAASDAVSKDCVAAADGAPVGIVFRAERIEPGEAQPRIDEGIAEAARAGMESWIGRAKLLAVSLPEYQDAFVKLKTSLGEHVVGDGQPLHETVFGSPSEARTVLSRWLSDVLAASNRSTPGIERWRNCGGLMVIGTIRVSHRLDREKGFSDVRGSLQVTYFALSRDLTLIASDHDERPQSIFDSNGGYEEAVRTVVNRMVGTVGPKLAQKLSTFTHTEGCTAR